MAREKKEDRAAQPGKPSKQGGPQKDKKDAGSGMGRGEHADMEARERDDRERDRAEDEGR
jgi:hypothetical protein